jgi:branched-chain amino acid transport system substrate-binding protein
MKIRQLVLAAAVVATGATALLGGTAFAQAKQQYMPVLSYRTGPYAPNGTPIANGIVDYYRLTNARGGINGVKLLIEECETGYDTARSVEW